MKVSIPENLDLKQLLKSNPPQFGYDIGNFYYIIGLLTSIPANNKELQQIGGGYIPINAKLLQSKIHGYRRYLNYLISHGVLESDNHYIKGEKSKHYRFCPLFKKKGVEVVIEKYSLIKQHAKDKRSYKAFMRQLPMLSKWFDNRLTIDYSAAFDFISYMLKVNEDKGVENALLKFECAFYNIRRLRDNDIYFSIDQTVGRLHTNLTNLHKSIRHFIKFDSQKLVSVDISNSQPFLSVILFNKEFYESKKSSSSLSLNQLMNKDMVDTICIGSILSYIMIVNSEESVDSKGFGNFIDNVVNGTFYELISEEYTHETGIEIVDRRELKRIMFIVLFTDNRYWGQKDALAKRIFERLFPEVYRVFALMKRQQKNRLPCILQAIEAHIILNVVAKRISKERPDLPIFTIHDSITCTLGNEDYVSDVMRQEMTKLIGYTPQLKYEYWEPEIAYKEIPGYDKSKAA